MQDDKIDRKILQQNLREVQTPVAKMINSELKTVLEQAIRQLPEKYRAVFVMREIEDMNITETQECLDISKTNVKVRLNRAKALLKEYLGRFYSKSEILQFHLLRCDRVFFHVMNKIEATGNLPDADSAEK